MGGVEGFSNQNIYDATIQKLSQKGADLKAGEKLYVRFQGREITVITRSELKSEGYNKSEFAKVPDKLMAKFEKQLNKELEAEVGKIQEGTDSVDNISKLSRSVQKLQASRSSLSIFTKLFSKIGNKGIDKESKSLDGVMKKRAKKASRSVMGKQLFDKLPDGIKNGEDKYTFQLKNLNSAFQWDISEETKTGDELKSHFRSHADSVGKILDQQSGSWKAMAEIRDGNTGQTLTAENLTSAYFVTERLVTNPSFKALSQTFGEEEKDNPFKKLENFYDSCKNQSASIYLDVTSGKTPTEIGNYNVGKDADQIDAQSFLKETGLEDILNIIHPPLNQ